MDSWTDEQKRKHILLSSAEVIRCQIILRTKLKTLTKGYLCTERRIKSSLGHIPPSTAIKMFDSYILPILEYNSTFWSTNSEILKIEKVQISYLKHVLNVRRQTPTVAVYAETGRFPLRLRQQLTTVNYWARLTNLPNQDVLNKCLKIQEKLHNAGQNNWYSKMRKVMTEVNLRDCQNAKPSSVSTEVKLKLYAKEQERIMNEVNDSDKFPKLRTYKLFKTNYCLEPYLNLNLSKKTWSNISRFRLSSHNLHIETGRHNIPKTPVEQRKCDKCKSNDVEDEIHCLLVCSNNISARNELLNKARGLIPNFDSLDRTEQFTLLLSDKRSELILALGSYLTKVMK